MTGKKLQAHPLADIFPEISQSEIDQLATDIKANGLQERIVLYEGKILDGRNRYSACSYVGVEPEYQEYKGADPLAYVISMNLHRRHLSDRQRAEIAARLATQKHGGDRKSGIKWPIGHLNTKDAAKLLNVSPRSVRRVRKAQENSTNGSCSAANESNEAVTKVRGDDPEAVDKIQDATPQNTSMAEQKILAIKMRGDGASIPQIVAATGRHKDTIKGWFRTPDKPGGRDHLKKTDDSRVLELAKEGMLQKDIAQKLGCGATAISGAFIRLGLVKSRTNPIQKLVDQVGAPAAFIEGLAVDDALLEKFVEKADSEQILELADVVKRLRNFADRLDKRLREVAKRRTR